MTENQNFLQRHWPFLAGILITVVVDILLAEVLGDQSKGFVVVATLAGIVLAVQLEVLARTAEREQRDIAISNVITALHRQPDMIPAIEGLARLAAVPSKVRDRAGIRRETLHCLTDAGARLDQLANGRVECEKSDVHMMEAEYKRATPRTHVRATSGDRDLDWWEGRLGKEYLEWNRESKANIDRIFVIYQDIGSAELGRMLRVMADNVNADVTVYVVPPEDSRDLPWDLKINVTIFDNRVFHEDVLNDQSETLSHRYSMVNEEVDKKIELWKQLRDRAKPYDEFVATAGSEAVRVGDKTS